MKETYERFNPNGKIEGRRRRRRVRRRTFDQPSGDVGDGSGRGAGGEKHLSRVGLRSCAWRCAGALESAQERSRTREISGN
ncbi:hypothetical protein M0802_010909 [Mischocyttarus mexicanus]|nr:hypothetical protein M0802_010909 [Mischocyttarus mexicanus]